MTNTNWHSLARGRNHRRSVCGFGVLRCLLLVWVIPFVFLSPNVNHITAWEWTDVLGGGSTATGGGRSGTSTASLLYDTNTLTAEEIREMRVRDIKRRLARTHGYSADELGRMLDKKELIEALTTEERKDRQKEIDKIQWVLMVRGILVAVAAVVVVMGCPVWAHLMEVASVNWAVYTDRKRLEASRCIEYGSVLGMIGVFIMAILDLMQTWLTASVLLSWIMTSRYFFPIPSLPVRPAQLMGEKVANGPMGQYGINVAPMAVTWSIRFLQGRLESWTGKVLSRAYQKQKREARAWESEDDKAARKAARKAAKRAAKEEAEREHLEEQAQEARRRKEAADQATSQLFPNASRPQRPTSVGEADAKQTDDTESSNLGTLLQEEEDARRQFEADLQELDINDLD
jgi:hypothetical protein